MRYIPNSNAIRRQMLTAMGVPSVDSLFESIPPQARLNRPLNLPPGMSEPDQMDHMAAVAEANRGAGMTSFLGAGCYNHFIPLTISTLTSRAEFFTAYTPYQPEIAQGTLQATFEFQTFTCLLTGMDVANASLYCGASATAEAVLMALRIKKGRRKVALAATLHPHYRQVVETYTRYLDVELETLPADPKTGRVDQAALAKLGPDTACLVVQSPNVFGVVEDLSGQSAAAHGAGALAVAVVNEPYSLALLQPPGKLGFDIVAGEAQAFGIPMGFGGPHLGFMAAREEFLRQMPGRICGQTVDADGRRGFVLTLSTREQHIRREKATSNICTNQSLMMLRAVIHLTLMGPEGLKEAARQSAGLARWFESEALKIKGYKLRYTGPRFNETALVCPVPAQNIVALGEAQGLVPGLDLGRLIPGEDHTLLAAFTENNTLAQAQNLIALLKEAAQ
ncbi:MAG: aminomethyl-transferring glycine dehydrogenase subunit GcvPA [Deltaproteobacteria bacterium]|nr:aminomethyl-transferring glycine dehydrogenase subunit GcvPA [Deltaproteobacteria bacterium]